MEAPLSSPESLPTPRAAHLEMVGAVLRPYIAPEICWIVRHHGLFQMYYYAHHSGGDRNARDRYRDHPWFDACAEFCERYDENCFDPGYHNLPLETFTPMVHEVFRRTPRAHA